MRLRHLVPVLVVLCALVASVDDAAAIRSAGVSGKLGLVSPDQGDNEIVFGASWLFEQPNTLWRFSPEFLTWSSNAISDIILDVNAYYDFMPYDRISPYAGGGLGMHFYEIDVPAGADADNQTDFAANLLGGVRGPAWSNVEWFAEARYIITDNDQLMLLGGVTFIFGRGGGGSSTERGTATGY